MKNNIKFSKIILSILAAFSATIPFINFKYFDIKLFMSITNVFILSIIFLLVLYINRKDYEIKKSKIVLSILFSIFMIIGETLTYSGTIFSINIIFFIIKLVGYTYMFISLFYVLDIILDKIKLTDFKPKNKFFKWYIEKLEKYPLRTSLITMLIFWSPYIIAFYPIILNPDSSFQIMQFFNVKTKYIEWVIPRNSNVNMTTHHPIIQTVLLGLSILFGRRLGSDNLGLFTYSILQILTLSFTLSLTIKELDKNKVNNKIKLILLLIYSLVPCFPFYAMTAVKDTFYTCFIIMFVIFLYEFVKNYKDKKLSIKSLIYLLVVSLLASMFRNNGLYVIALTFIFIIFYSKVNMKNLSLVFVIFLVSITYYNKVLIPSFGISDGSIREALSVPFQQTARLAKYDGEEIDKKDKKTIDKVLNYKTLAKRYNPNLADNVKNEYNKYTTKEELKDYFKVWFKYLKKEPLIYLDATLNNTYGYIYPNTHSGYLYSNYDSRIVYGYDKYGEEKYLDMKEKKKKTIKDDKYKDLGITEKKNYNHGKKYTTEYYLKFDKPLVNYHFNRLEGLRNILIAYGNIFPYIPFIGLIVSIGFSTWLLLITSVYLKNKNYKLILIPLYLSVLVCLVSPANTYFRYAVPVIFTLPFLIILFLNDRLKSK